jgi:hypothetical protein
MYELDLKPYVQVSEKILVDPYRLNEQKQSAKVLRFNQTKD